MSDFTPDTHLPYLIINWTHGTIFGWRDTLEAAQEDAAYQQSRVGCEWRIFNTKEVARTVTPVCQWVLK